MTDGFNDSILAMQAGAVPTTREFVCPQCGGMAHLRAGTLHTRPADWLWLEAWCEDCGSVEKYDGVQAWAGIEAVLKKDTEHFTLAENIQRIRRFARKGQQIQALRLYRQLYHVDLQQARSAIEKLMSEE